MLAFPRVLDVVLLISLGISYIVLYFAKREEKGLRLIGYFIGTLILGLTVAYMVGDLIVQNRIVDARLRYHQKMLQSAPAMPRHMK